MRTSRLPASISSAGSPWASASGRGWGFLFATQSPDVVGIGGSPAAAASGARHKRVRARAHRKPSRLRVDSPVQLPVAWLAHIFDSIPYLLDLANLAGAASRPAH